MKFEGFQTGGQCELLFGRPYGGGDPHFRSWGQLPFDYHGVCDLVLVASESFNKGMGLNLHARTKSMKHGAYSHISILALQIGNDVLEVHAYGKFLFNGEDMDYLPLQIGGLPLRHEVLNEDATRQKFVVDLGNSDQIVLSSYRNHHHYRPTTLMIAGAPVQQQSHHPQRLVEKAS